MLVINTFIEKMIYLSQYLIQLVIRSISLDFFVLRKSYSLGHLRHFGEYVIGPIQRDEALFIYALVKTVDPKTIVEFGFYQGHSAVNFLAAMSSSAVLHSYDVSDTSLQIAKGIRDDRFRFIYKSQIDFNPHDIENRLIDLAFFDASHDFDLNITTFNKVIESLSERALIVVHDTGVWHGELKSLRTPAGHFKNGSTSAGYIHQPGERKFVNYIRENMEGFHQIHLHSTTKFRHGLTVIQRNTDSLSL